MKSMEGHRLSTAQRHNQKKNEEVLVKTHETVRITVKFYNSSL